MEAFYIPNRQFFKKSLRVKLNTTLILGADLPLMLSNHTGNFSSFQIVSKILIEAECFPVITIADGLE